MKTDSDLSLRDRAELEATIEASPALTELLAFVRGRISQDPGHDLSHCLRVALWTLRIGSASASVSVEEAVAAALLHDIINVPKNHPDRARASELCAAFAREHLASFGFEPDAIDRVAGAIRDHSFSRGATPETPLGDALQDADRLEALGVIGLMRTISTGTLMGARYFHDADPWAVARPLDDLAWSIDHFSTKLLKLATTFRTPLGRSEATRRTAFLAHCVRELGHELGVSAEPVFERLARADAAPDRA